MTAPYTLSMFVENLRAIVAESKDDKAIVKRVRPLAQRLASSPSWLEPHHFQCDQEQGFGFHLLHEESDHTLALAVLSWLPGRGTPPHNHRTWAIVVGVKGTEKNTFWRRVDDGSKPGYAKLEKIGEKDFAVGEPIIMFPDTIHSVVNETSEITVSLHVYGTHINYTGRSQFDVERNVETPWTVKLA